MYATSSERRCVLYNRQGWGINLIPDRIIDLKSKEEVIDRQCIHDLRRASSDIGTNTIYVFLRLNAVA
jgi:hypothetical protein